MFYKIGGALQFLTGLAYIFYGNDMYECNLSDDAPRLDGYRLICILFFLYASFSNLLIARSGMPIGLYRSFLLINLGTWIIVVVGSFFTGNPIHFVLNCLILLAFLFAFFRKTKF